VYTAAPRLGNSVSAVFQAKSRVMSMLKEEVAKLECNVGAVNVAR
jgi:hypothetical protein